jgi:hypothetical protein
MARLLRQAVAHPSNTSKPPRPLPVNRPHVARGPFASRASSFRSASGSAESAVVAICSTSARLRRAGLRFIDGGSSASIMKVSPLLCFSTRSCHCWSRARASSASPHYALCLQAAHMPRLQLTSSSSALVCSQWLPESHIRIRIRIRIRIPPTTTTVMLKSWRPILLGGSKARNSSTRIGDVLCRHQRWSIPPSRLKWPVATDRQTAPGRHSQDTYQPSSLSHASHATWL